MKEHYKIKVDEPQLSPERIDSHKNFNKVLADYHNLTQPLYKRPLYKNPKAFGGLMLILSMAAMVYIAVQEDDAAASKAATTDSVAVEQKSVFAPTFATATQPAALSAPPSEKIQVAGVRGTFNLSGLDQPAQILRYSSANDLIAAGVPSLSPTDHGLVVEDVLSLQVGNTDRPLTYTWSQVRQEGAQLELMMWDESTHQWLTPVAPTREKIAVASEEETSQGDDGFRAIEFGTTSNAGQEVKSSTAHEGKRQQERFTWSLQVNRIYRLAHRVPETNVLPIISLQAKDEEGKNLTLQRLMLVYEDGNLQAMELRDGAWTCDLGEGATAAYGFTPAGELVYLPSSALQNGKANTFQRWDGAVETPDALLRKLFAQQP